MLEQFWAFGLDYAEPKQSVAPSAQHDSELNPPRREMKAYMRAKAIPATQSGVVEISDCPL